MLLKNTTLSLALLSIGAGVFAQADPCLAWTSLDGAKENEALETHMFYRDKIKVGDLEGAYPLWEKAYTMAPAADGQRPFHYTDGRALFLDKYANATTDEEKDEYAAMVYKLYEQERECYPGNEAQSLSLQVYDMFYTMQRPYTETYPVAKKAMAVGEEQTDYRVVTPMGYLVAYMFSNELIDQPEAREMIEQERRIVEAHASMDDADEYATAGEAADVAIASVERSVFDCEYFKARYEPMYRANPNDPETWKEVYTQLAAVACQKEDPLMAEIIAKDRAYEQLQYEQNNPLAAAKKMLEGGDAEGAMQKLNETAEAETNPEKKGAIYLNMASLYRSEMNSSSQARNYARKAAAARPGWGKPYIMIGDLYASSSRSCSDDPFGQRLVVIAALDQYARAKSDPETASDARDRINKYSGSLPTREMLFERGIKEGESRSTGCWVGETVTVRAAL